MHWIGALVRPLVLRTLGVLLCHTEGSTPPEIKVDHLQSRVSGFELQDLIPQ